MDRHRKTILRAILAYFVLFGGTILGFVYGFTRAHENKVIAGFLIGALIFVALTLLLSQMNKPLKK